MRQKCLLLRRFPDYLLLRSFDEFSPSSYLMYCWPCITVHQYSETNVMHILFNLLRINSLYMFRALLPYLREGLNKRHSVHCVRVMSVDCTRIGAANRHNTPLFRNKLNRQCVTLVALYWSSSFVFSLFTLSFSLSSYFGSLVCSSTLCVVSWTLLLVSSAPWPAQHYTHALKKHPAQLP
jgi:hypothetical protein